jgi:hypothetical protein
VAGLVALFGDVAFARRIQAGWWLKSPVDRAGPGSRIRENMRGAPRKKARHGCTALINNYADYVTRRFNPESLWGCDTA